MQVQELETLQVDLQEVIRNAETFFAHTSKSEKCPLETLPQHTKRCIFYFKQLWQEKNIGEIIARMEEELLKDLSTKGKMVFQKIVVNTIAFHDVGKINPRFQCEAMGQKQWKNRALDCLVSKKHAMLSAAVYLDYFMAELDKLLAEKEIEKEEMQQLYVVLLVNAYVITRHHSDLTKFSDFLLEFQMGGGIQQIFEAMDQGAFAEILFAPFDMSRLSAAQICKKNQVCFKKWRKMHNTQEEILTFYTYTRFLYSLLIACDYYATTEYCNENKIQYVGEEADGSNIKKIYENSELQKKIKIYRKENTHDTKEEKKDINVLRNQMFIEAEKILLENKEKDIFFLEAPTGAGKSNMAINCSLKLLEEHRKRLIYVYPYNTLVEQNFQSMEQIFGRDDISQKIAVLNSITPIKTDKKQEEEEDSELFYQKALLDRQFWNYPIVLTTHVNLFETMFSCEKEQACSFYQLSGSVVVLDEIQSYKNTLWTEIMMFLQVFSKLLNMKILIMSATLPNLDCLTGETESVQYLIKNRDFYFEDARFKNRVKISYELLQEKIECDTLERHICAHTKNNKKILVEFIRKETAERVYREMKELTAGDKNIEVLCMMGDDNQLSRERILNILSENNLSKSIILIATQVVEAGIDIDMDIGYKDISKLDSEEQFMGRINRNFRRDGMVYFFDLDEASKIYHQDFRISNPHYTLKEETMQQILKEKKFGAYYQMVLQDLKTIWNDRLNENGLEAFLNAIGDLNFGAVQERMKLIEEDQWHISIFLEKILVGDEVWDGNDVWEQYKALLKNQTMEYSKKQVALSRVRSKMNVFIYQIKKNTNIVYSDRIGELYKINDSEKYFVDGRFDKKRLEIEETMFI